MNGDNAFVPMMDAVFRNHYAWLRRWLGFRTPSGQCPDDVASETLLRMTRIAMRESVIEPRAMMTTIARRILYDLSARHDLQRAYESAIATLPIALEPSAEDRYLAIEALGRIECTLKPLSLNARSAFLLSQIDGFSHAEIAAMLGVSVSMVRKYIASAMKACYREFENDE